MTGQMNGKGGPLDRLRILYLYLYKKIGVFIRPVSFWLEELRVMGITPCHGYPFVSQVSLSVRFVCEENRVA
jgi:hypothetical protein